MVCTTQKRVFAPVSDRHMRVDTNPNHEKPQHIESRRVFYKKLRDKIKIPGITSVERDTTYDDETLRNVGLRLSYDTHFGSIAASRMEFSWKLASIRRLRTARLRFLPGSQSLQRPRSSNTQTTGPSTSSATTPNTLSWKRFRLWFENMASSRGPGKCPRIS